MTHVEDVLRETPLFEALSDEDASALRSGIINVIWTAASGCSPRATPATSFTSSCRERSS